MLNWWESQTQTNKMVLIAAVVGAVLTVVLGGLLSTPDSQTASDGGIIQTNENGKNIVNSGSGQVNTGDAYYIGITLEQYEQGLKRRELEVRAELKLARAKDRQRLEIELQVVQTKLQNSRTSYEAHLSSLKQRTVQMESLRGQVPDDLLGQVKEAQGKSTSDLKTYGERHPDVALHRNNLGNAKYVLGETQKTIENCNSIPSEISQQDYGVVKYSLTASCYRKFSLKEQLFVAGLSQWLLSVCDYPIDIDSRVKLQKFLISSALVGAMGSKYKTAPLGESMSDQIKGGVAMAMGEKFGKEIDCNPASERIAKNIVHYLDRSSGEGSRYVAGCVQNYRGRYTKKQCQCLADIGRSVFPNIHQTAFTSGSIKRIIESNPFVGLQILQCGIVNY